MIARGFTIVVVVVMLLAASASACLWDTDTLQMERKRFPGAYELITGRFVRHSTRYYEWRVADRLKRLRDHPGDPKLIDDLAVAYDKLGRHAEGIAVLERSRSEHPDRYETIANLGTLSIHAGKLDEGAELIDQAIRINPQSHFGREKYQLLLVRYIQQSMLKTQGVLSAESRWRQHEAVGFARFVLEQQRLPSALIDSDSAEWQAQAAELDAAQKGILGIMHFGNFESPIVLEALGDVLLRSGEGWDDARLLAARAYLKAGSHASNPQAIAAYESMAHDALTANEDYHRKPRNESVVPVAGKLQLDVEQAKEWFQQISADEAEWIRSGVDVDEAFAAKYYDSLDGTIDAAASAVAQEPLDERDRDWYGRGMRRGHSRLAAMAAGALIACYAVYRGVRVLRARK